MKRNRTSAVVSPLAAACLVSLAGPMCVWASTVTVVDIGNLGGGTSSASYINNEGDVAGFSSNLAGNNHAFFYNGILHDIGTFGGTLSFPKGLNASGEVSGTAYTAGSQANAFVYHNGVLTNLGSLGGTQAFGFGLNDAGTVAGSGYLAGNNISHAALSASPWNPPAQDLGTLGGSQGEADFINNSGQIAGNANLAGDSHRLAFYSQNGSSLVALSLSGTSSAVTGINSVGQVIGTSATGVGSIRHGFIYTPGTSTLTDLGTIGGFSGNSDAEAVDSAGEVVGQSDVAPGKHHAYFYTQVNSAWTMTDLGTLNSGLGNSTADAINTYGEIVGTASAPVGTDPFLYLNGVMIDLNTLLADHTVFTQLLTATGINDEGVITGQGITASGATDAYVLTYSAAALPEPSTVTLMMLGLLIFAAAFMRRRVRN